MIEASDKEDGRIKFSQLVTHLNPDGLAIKMIADYEISAYNYPGALADLEKEFLGKKRNRKDLLGNQKKKQ